MHGTIGGYVNAKCRCEACREAWNSYHREYKRRRRANGGDPLNGITRYTKQGEAPVVVAAPFADWLRRQINELGVTNVAASIGITTQRAIDIASESTGRYLAQDFVARALGAFGQRLSDLYWN